MARTDSTRGLSQLVILIAAIVVIATLYFARVVFVPFALAVLFSFLLTPIVSLLDRIHIPRAASSFAVVAVAVLTLGALGWVVTGELVDVANQLPDYRANIKRKIEAFQSSKSQGINKAADAVIEIAKELAAPGPAPETAASSSGPRGLAAGAAPSAKPIPVQVVPQATSPLESLNSFAGPVSIFGIVTIFTFFMLVRREDLRNRLIRMVGHGHLNVMTQAMDDASSRVSRYLFLQLSVNAGYGLVVGFGLYWIGVPHVLLWGVLAALLRFLPYVGFLLSSALPILLSLAMFDGWTRPLLTLALYVAVDLVLGNLVEPILYGAHVGLSSLAILVSAVFWTVLWGPIGLVLATPLTVCLVVMGRHVPNLGFLNIVLGDDPVLLPEAHFYQRLLASDQHEAKRVLEKYLDENNLQQLYDAVLIPALSLAEQDRHQNNLDEATQQFITLSTRELIEELWDRTSEAAAQAQRELPEENPAEAGAPPHPIVPHLSPTIVCVPARDDADEIVGTMLAQLLEQAGYQSQCIPIGTIADMLALVSDAKPDMLCISALPPFAISHARNLYQRLRAHSPSLKILMGLWGFSGDRTKIATRMRLKEGDRVFISLDQMVAEINVVVGFQVSPESEAPSPVLVPSPATKT